MIKKRVVFALLIAFALASSTTVFASTKTKKSESVLVASNTILSDIPAEYQDKLVILSPDADSAVTSKPYMLVKGVNRFQTAVFINGEQVGLREDGRFMKEIDFKPKSNEQSVLISFLLPNYQQVHIQKGAKYLSGPNDLAMSNPKAHTYLVFLNSRFVAPQMRLRLLQEPLTRAELAYFASALATENAIEGVTGPVLLDVPKESWAAGSILYALDSRFMGEFSDGLFHPERTVTRLEYVMTVVRALRLPLIATKPRLPFQDVDSSHWSARFIAAALAAQVIPSGNTFAPSVPITRMEFMRLALQLKRVQSEIEKPVAIQASVDPELLSATVASMNQLMNRLMTKSPEKDVVQSLDVRWPKNRAVVYRSEVNVQGRIQPSLPLEINQDPIMPNPDGDFSASLRLNREGLSVVEVSGNGMLVTRNVFYFQGYDDLSKHWVEGTAAKMRYLGLAENTPSFNPNENLTRRGLAKMLVYAFGWMDELPTQNNLEVDPFEQVLLDKAIYSAPTKVTGNFEPEMNRGEIIVALSRCLTSRPSLSKHALEEDLFKDLDSARWAYLPAMYLLDQKILLPSRRIYPKRPMTKAEFISILGRVPAIRDKIQALTLQ